MHKRFMKRLKSLEEHHEQLIRTPNAKEGLSNGIVQRYRNPVLTAAHTPLYWRYDMDAARNPELMERFSINAVFNAGAILFKGKYVLVARVEGADRKSFFAVAESDNGIDNFRFHEKPVL